jgi:hypothetical protein
MLNHSILFVLLLFVVVLVSTTITDAFTINAVSTTTRNIHYSPTILNMKFLKDLGFEKPSWLPDFGGASKNDDEEKVNDSDDAKPEEAKEETSEAVVGEGK